MGKIFLGLIVLAGAYGAWSVYSNISKLTNPAERKTVTKVLPENLEGQDTGREIKRALASSSSEKTEPIPVLSSNHEWIQIEAWGIIEAGDQLPDGSKLESWDEKGAVVLTSRGREHRRFRTFLEAMAKMAPAAAAGQVSALDFGANK
jgi:hypothetical protein